MRTFKFWDLWRGLNEHLALPISLIAVLLTGLSYCSDQRNVAEERLISQAVVWRSAKSTEVDGMLTLHQPNEAVAIQRVEFTFPRSLRSDPISLPPSQLEIRGTWIESGMQARLFNCRKENSLQIVEGQMPVRVTTSYSVAGKSRLTTDIYTLSYMAYLGGDGSVELELESLAIAETEAVGNSIDPMMFDWQVSTCGVEQSH